MHGTNNIVKSASDNSCSENQKTFYVQLLFEIHTVYEIMWKNIVHVRQNTDNNEYRMSIACRIPKATNTHSEYVIRIAFSQQQWLYERASVLRYTYIACLLSLP